MADDIGDKANEVIVERAREAYGKAIGLDMKEEEEEEEGKTVVLLRRPVLEGRASWK